MPCVNPLNAFKTAGGVYSFSGRPGMTQVQLPCGQCISCRLERSRQWATRCMHEAHMHENNWWVTLTYSDENLPEKRSLKREDFTNFIKRFRKHGAKIRYFACGEYGDNTQRPHYHAILFGAPRAIESLQLHSRGSYPLYTDDFTTRVWGLGHAVIGAVTFESAAYTARYVCKKITGNAAKAHYRGRTPEFSAMSLKPGIGAQFFYKYYEDITNYDRCTTRGGRHQRLPRYYDKLLRSCDDALYHHIKYTREQNALYSDKTAPHLGTIEKSLQLKFNNKMRNIE